LAHAAELERRGNKQAASDLTQQANRLALEALDLCPKNLGLAEISIPDNADTSREMLDALKSRHGEINAAKAAEVSPVLYAHMTAELGRASIDLDARRWRSAAARLPWIEAGLETIIQQDSDVDGVADLLDESPNEAEDKDGFQDSDGAPDADNDADGILDLNDSAPNKAETINNWQDHDGAPDAAPVLDPIPFASGSASLSAESRGYLRATARLLAASPGLTLHIKGHTDNVHSSTYNIDLSRRRAATVQRYLLSTGAPAHQLLVTHYGNSQPLTGNATAADRAQNRRVELVLE
jgi:outer membrane protein OmpA-like peptidoglycan-associated protein